MRNPLLAAALFLAAPAAVQADPVLQAILAQSAQAPVVGFERTVRAELRADPAKEPATVVERFVPETATSGRWTLVSVDGRKPTEKEQEATRKANEAGVIPGFHRLHKLFAMPPTRRSAAGDKTVYHWASLPPGAVVTPGGDISGKLSAEATVETLGGKPMISLVRIFAGQPFKIRGVATMNAFSVVSHYRPGAGGLPFLTSQTSASDVKAPFGMGGKRRNEISFRPI
jgi:hypothetical protein